MTQDLKLETMPAVAPQASCWDRELLVSDWEDESRIESELTYFHYSSPNAEFILSSMNKKLLLEIL